MLLTLGVKALPQTHSGALRLIKYSIRDVRLPFAGLSVCAIGENLLPGRLERSGRRAYR